MTKSVCCGAAAAVLLLACSSNENTTSSGPATTGAGAGATSGTGAGGSGSSSGTGTGGGSSAGCPAGTARCVTFINSCAEPIWAAALNAPQYALPEGGGWKLDPGQSYSIALPEQWGGRFWGRSGCVFDSSGMGSCATADCGGKEQCGGNGGKPPATLAEITFAGFGGKDFYDISLVDGYNLPMGMAPKPGTYTVSDPNDPYECGSPGCTSDLNATCPGELQVMDGGKVVACLSACEKFGTDEYCCKGAFGSPTTCMPTSYSQIFKTACPSAYSYAYDDPTSTFTCAGRDYEITFCP